MPDYYSGYFSLFFVRPQTSTCMYHFLVQTLIGLRGTQLSRVRVPALTRNFFEHLGKRTRLKVPLFQFLTALCDFFDFFAFKGSTSFFLIFFCNKLDFQKVQRGALPFYIFRNYETVSKFSFFVSNYVLNIYSQILFYYSIRNRHNILSKRFN